MASTPPPPAGSTDGDASDGDWRSSVLQSYRNTEVREIAKVLAMLEPGATVSTKLMLAMRFEDTIFKSATSLGDYRKKLTKRLKKLQKNYVPPAQSAPGNTEDERTRLLIELRQKYGDGLRYISENAAKAVSKVRESLGDEKSVQLRQHTDSAKQWIQQVGLLESDRQSEQVGSAKSDNMTKDQLLKLKEHLEQRVENIRQYVLKFADPDLFLHETLKKKDQELPDRACQLLGINLKKRVQQLQQPKAEGADVASPAFDPLQQLQESLSKGLSSNVPPPTRNNSNDLAAATVNLDIARQASSALVAYLALADRKSTAPLQAFAKTNSLATKGISFLKQSGKKSEGVTTTSTGQDDYDLKLADVWTKTLAYDNVAGMDDSRIDLLSSPAAKRSKMDHLSPVTSSRVLLKARRKTPPHLLPALRRKRALLVRPPPCGFGSHIILDFGKAFRMKIFFSPLVVTFRALSQEYSDLAAEKTVGGGGAMWTPLHHGLVRDGLSTSETESSPLETWGVSGSYTQIGHVVEERLRDASTYATHVLRRCFRNHVRDKTVEYEIEILEASALLEFVQIARTTYIPGWQDDS